MNKRGVFDGLKLKEIHADTRPIVGMKSRYRGCVCRGKMVLRLCQHEHRSRKTAEDCARVMLSQHRAQMPSYDIPSPAYQPPIIIHGSMITAMLRREYKRTKRQKNACRKDTLKIAKKGIVGLTDDQIMMVARGKAQIEGSSNGMIVYREL
jgi:hypothetical protein